MQLPVDVMDTSLFAAATQVTVHNGQRASFWNSSWISGQAPSILYMATTEGEHRTVREAILNGQWIRDIAFSLNNDLLGQYFRLWSHI